MANEVGAGPYTIEQGWGALRRLIDREHAMHLPARAGDADLVLGWFVRRVSELEAGILAMQERRAFARMDVRVLDIPEFEERVAEIVAEALDMALSRLVPIFHPVDQGVLKVVWPGGIPGACIDPVFDIAATLLKTDKDSMQCIGSASTGFFFYGAEDGGDGKAGEHADKLLFDAYRHQAERTTMTYSEAIESLTGEEPGATEIEPDVPESATPEIAQGGAETIPLVEDRPPHRAGRRFEDGRWYVWLDGAFLDWHGLAEAERASLIDRCAAVPAESHPEEGHTMAEAFEAGYRQGYGNGRHDEEQGEDTWGDEPGEAFEHWINGDNGPGPF